MRLRAVFFAVVVLAGAGAAAYKLAEIATARYEAATAEQLRAALQAAGQGWAAVATDGLEVTLAGAAPDETSRFRALEIARQIVDARRIEDTTTLAASEPLPPAPFALELLRNEGEVSLIGLVPETGGRDVIRAALSAGGLAANVTDMLESASDPAPDGWQAALGFGLSVLAELPRAKISVAPGQVRVVAVADSAADRADLEERLERGKPEGVTLVLEISAPRAVIAPFAFDFSLKDGAGRLDACSAESEAAAEALLAAAAAAGLPAGAECRIGLGSPSVGWGAAVARGLDAVRELGGGRFALHDIAAELSAPAATPAGKLAEVAARLDARLPDVFQLTTAAPEPAEAKGAPRPVPEFGAAVTEDGAVRLSGAVTDTTSQDAILSYAAALFGHDRVLDTTVIEPGLPAGWPGRVLAGIEVLAGLMQGTLVVTPETVAVAGWSLDQHADAKLEAMLAAKVGDAAVVEVTYNAEAAAAATYAVRPRPEICADQISAILDVESIQFGAGSAEIVPKSRGVIAAIADVLRGCPGSDFEIDGHTDSQGAPEANQGLSEQRAQAVLAALRAEDLPMVRLTARGFGAGDPVADNASEAGRASNRRIEFRLVPPDAGEPPAVETEGTGETPDAEAGAASACLDAIGVILAEEPIPFAAGEATLAEESGPVIEALAAALRGCPEMAFEIGGYTDSQGSDGGNLRLSQARAEAVLAALRAHGLPLAGSAAHGYGEADPVADNATEEGRAQNRRIAFAPRDAAPAAEGEGAGEGEAAAAGEADAACLQAVEAVLAKGSIQFAAGSATLAGESAGVIDAIAAALEGCPDVAMEIAGHTDSQGSESWNQTLSQERAEAVLAALRAHDDLPLPQVTARGYGASAPVADNATAEGRAQNRRIAFSLAVAEGDGSGDGSQ